MAASRLLLVPARMLSGAAKVSVKAGYKTAKTGIVTGARTAAGSARAGYQAGRAVGYGRTAVFAAGVAVGVLVASPKARAGVSQVGKTLWSIRRHSRGPTDREIEELVGRRLSGAQATWYLPQPDVSVTDGRVRLVGEAPDAAARRALAETASETDGVREVDNQVTVPADGEGPAATSDNGVSARAVTGPTAA